MAQPARPALEGKLAATHRLQREGRWGEATAYKDKVADDLKAAGLKRSEANREAWAQMIAAFPPLEEKGRSGTSPSDANAASLLPPDQFTAMADLLIAEAGSTDRVLRDPLLNEECALSPKKCHCKLGMDNLFDAVRLAISILGRRTEARRF